MPWGQEHTRVEPLLGRGVQHRLASDALVTAARKFLREPTTGNRERLERAVERYDAVAYTPSYPAPVGFLGA